MVMAIRAKRKSEACLEQNGIRRISLGDNRTYSGGDGSRNLNLWLPGRLKASRDEKQRSLSQLNLLVVSNLSRGNSQARQRVPLEGLSLESSYIFRRGHL